MVATDCRVILLSGLVYNKLLFWNKLFSPCSVDWFKLVLNGSSSEVDHEKSTHHPDLRNDVAGF